jgi:hypothetical protein
MKPMQVRSTAPRAILRRLLASSFVSIAILARASVAAAAISVSGDTSMPSQDSGYTISPFGSVQVNENVMLSPSFGPWRTHLVNGPQPWASGQDISVTQTYVNLGSAPWGAWHENVISTTQIGGGPDPEPGFLFDHTSLSVQANYGSGFITLAEGVDYTVMPTVYSGPPAMGNPDNWEAFTLRFAPARVIGVGNTLRIGYGIFEVFGDGDPWRPEEEAVLAQFPTAVPEPAAAALCTLAIAAALRRRRNFNA